MNSTFLQQHCIDTRYFLGILSAYAKGEKFFDSKGDFDCDIVVDGIIVPSDNCEYYGTCGVGYNVYDLDKGIQSAIDDGKGSVDVLFNTNGGLLAGVDDVANRILSYRDKIQMNAIVPYVCASAGYYLASAMQNIYVSGQASIGGIGVISTFYSVEKALNKIGIETHTFTNKQSPIKNFDLKNNDAVDDYKRSLDELGQQFIDFVANARGKSSSWVEREFGRGATLVGTVGYERGLADGLVNYSADNGVYLLSGNTIKKRGTMSKKIESTPVRKVDESELKEARENGYNEGIKVEMARQKAIDELVTADNLKFVNKLKYAHKDSGEFYSAGDIAIALIQEQKKASQIVKENMAAVNKLSSKLDNAVNTVESGVGVNLDEVDHTDSIKKFVEEDLKNMNMNKEVK